MFSVSKIAYLLIQCQEQYINIRVVGAILPIIERRNRHLKVRSGKHIRISPLTFKKTKPSVESAIRDHLLNCNNILFFEEFTILTNENNKFDLEIKESLLVKRDRVILNKKISSAKLFLFDNSYLSNRFFVQ